MLLFSQGCLDLDVRGFVEPYPNDNNNYKTYVINKMIPLSEAFGHIVKYTGFVGCVVIVWEVQT
jgi:hypothetical protein